MAFLTRTNTGRKRVAVERHALMRRGLKQDKEVILVAQDKRWREIKMDLALHCYIEDITAFHPNLALEHIVVITVCLMTKYSDDNCCDFDLGCQNIISDWLKEADKGTLRVQWKDETAEHIPKMIRTHHEIHLTEFAAIGITCILFPKVVNLTGMEVSERGTRADYWINNKQYLIEISGTETEGELFRRHREKVEQLLDNPDGKDGYVVVVCFSSKNILFSFHRQEEVNMANKPNPPYSDDVQRIIGDKSSTLLQARLCQSLGLKQEAEKFFDFAANKEERIANLLEAGGNVEDALINWISAASCYNMAGKYHQARDLFTFILNRYKKYMTEKRLNEVKQLKEECDEAIKKQEGTFELT
jgi:hypothetical protein